LTGKLNLEDAMTDFRDPNYRDPKYGDPNYGDPMRPAARRKPGVSANPNHWSTATWGWIAGISVVVLILIFAFGIGGDRVATDTNRPQATTGQRTVPPAPPAGAPSEAPSMNPGPAPTPPAKQ
jgi:hypothetical protein